MQRLLLITLSNIGDCVMTTPVLERMHACYPRAKVDILVDARSAELFEHCPYRGRILLKDKRASLPGTLAMMRQLWARHYQLVVDLRTDGLAWLLRTSRRMTRLRKRGTGLHAVEEHMAAIRPLWQRQAAIGPARIWTAPAHEAFADQVLADLPPGRWLALAPGANATKKVWPAAHFARMVEQVADRFTGLVLLGGPGDVDRAKAVIEQTASRLASVNLAGRTDLLEAAAVLKRVDQFVGNDSGLGHIASAAGVATLTLFGPGEPNRYRPWGPRALWLVSPTGRIADLPVEQVAQTLLEATDRFKPLGSTPKEQLA